MIFTRFFIAWIRFEKINEDILAKHIMMVDNTLYAR